MAEDFSKKGLLEFLDFLGNKGLMNAATVAARKAATNTFLGILPDEELNDLRSLDLNLVEKRFFNLKGTQFKPASVKVYKSRVSSALTDLKNYRADPASFKGSTTAPKNSPSVKIEKETTSYQSSKANEKPVITAPEYSFPVPIRPDVIVRIIGIPSDLTKKEATRIANIVLALANDAD